MPATTDPIRDETVLQVPSKDRMPDLVILPAHDDTAVAKLTEATEQAA